MSALILVRGARGEVRWGEEVQVLRRKIPEACIARSKHQRGIAVCAAALGVDRIRHTLGRSSLVE